MDKLVIRGGHPLQGTLPVSGSKNTALALMSAALLTAEPVQLRHIPDLKDIRTFSRVMEVTGAQVTFNAAANSLQIDASELTRTEAPYGLVKRMRASFYMLGALLGRCGQARVSLPGGCAWGPRPVDLHIEGMKALGAAISLDKGYVVARARDGGRLPGGDFTLRPSSVGATINFLLGAVTAMGRSRLHGAATEPDVVEFCRMLTEMGAQIDGTGTRTLTISGVESLSGVTFDNPPDRIELGTFMIAAAIAGEAGKPVTLTHARPEHLGRVFMQAFEQTGCEIHVDGTTLEVIPPGVLTPVSISTDVYPGFPTDLQAQWTILLACADGNAKVLETIYHDRFKHIPELRRMGINAVVVGNEVAVEGGNPIEGTAVMSTDLRASVSLVLAGMVARGETHVLRVYHLDRGYERLEQKLSAAGIDIRREPYDEWADPV
ncbi:MAG: UDP-N-acetylglucosamine 1-carboxyvinyltransferase [Bacteroidetes bacterium CG12_big_fil_rev_8_21_14_0_65_60_17]|nr:MAG: UDP-N-acetylglucosamine 1-carboxyvinyltransferase [Bacteroidetes bacterium CG12_big_fil_rev_8_21_14_0_65_60_17]